MRKREMIKLIENLERDNKYYHNTLESLAKSFKELEKNIDKDYMDELLKKLVEKEYKDIDYMVIVKNHTGTIYKNGKEMKNIRSFEVSQRVGSCAEIDVTMV